MSTVAHLLKNSYSSVVTDAVADLSEPEVAGSDADGLRERLLRAAATVFARQGYAGARIMDIVRESGLSTGAVYGRFNSKSDLLREAVVRRAAQAARLDTADVGRVADLAAQFLVNATEPLTDAEAVRLEAFVAARREPDVAASLAEAARVSRAALEPLVEEAKRDGTLADDVDPEAAIFLVRILNLGLVLHRGAGLPAPDPRAWHDLVARVLASFGSPNRGDSGTASLPQDQRRSR